jgi:hypothetical protein
VKPAVPVQASELSGLARSFHQPVYWAGKQGSTQFDLTRNGTDRLYIRYLPPNGAPTPATGVLTVGTYRLPNAYNALLRAAKAPGAKTYKLPKHGRALVDAGNPTDVHLAYRSQPFQVEVFDPTPGRALKLVRSGQVRPVP